MGHLNGYPVSSDRPIGVAEGIHGHPAQIGISDRGFTVGTRDDKQVTGRVPDLAGRCLNPVITLRRSHPCGAIEIHAIANASRASDRAATHRAADVALPCHAAAAASASGSLRPLRISSMTSPPSTVSGRAGTVNVS